MHLRAHAFTRARHAWHTLLYNNGNYCMQICMHVAITWPCSISVTLQSYRNVFEYIKKWCAYACINDLWHCYGYIYGYVILPIYLSFVLPISFNIYAQTHARAHTHVYTWANRKQICRLTLHFDAAPIAELAQKNQSLDRSMDRSIGYAWVHTSKAMHHAKTEQLVIIALHTHATI